MLEFVMQRHGMFGQIMLNCLSLSARITLDEFIAICNRDKYEFVSDNYSIFFNYNKCWSDHVPFGGLKGWCILESVIRGIIDGLIGDKNERMASIEIYRDFGFLLKGWRTKFFLTKLTSLLSTMCNQGSIPLDSAS